MKVIIKDSNEIIREVDDCSADVCVALLRQYLYRKNLDRLGKGDYKVVIEILEE